MDEYNSALSALKSAQAGSNYTAQEQDAKQKLEKLNRLQREEEGKATKSLWDQEQERKEGVLKTFSQARDAATTLLKARNPLEDAQKRVEGEEAAEKEEMRHEFYVEHTRDHAEVVR